MCKNFCSDSLNSYTQTIPCLRSCGSSEAEAKTYTFAHVVNHVESETVPQSPRARPIQSSTLDLNAQLHAVVTCSSSHVCLNSLYDCPDPVHVASHVAYHVAAVLAIDCHQTRRACMYHSREGYHDHSAL